MKYSTRASMNIFEARKAYIDLTLDDIHILEEEGIFNGCGGKGGVSFDEVLEMVERFDYFDKNLFEKFHRDLKEQCKKHDYRYWTGGKWYNKVFADLALSGWLFMNLQWTAWYIAPATWIGSMVGLTRQGNKYFNFS